jgi:hypothetical protein
MAGYEKTTALADVRALLKQPGDGVVTDAMINEWLDCAARRISAVTLCNWTSEEVTIVTKQINYDLTTKFIRIEYALYQYDTTSSRALAKIRPEQIGRGYDVEANGPTGWFPREDSLWIWPALETVSSQKVTVFGYTLVDNYGGADSETLPDWLRSNTVNYALSCAYARMQKHRKSHDCMVLFLQGLGDGRQKAYDYLQNITTHDMTETPDYTTYQQ